MSLSHLIVTLLIVLILFGANRLSQIMAELGKGLKAFRDNLSNENKDTKE